MLKHIRSRMVFLYTLAIGCVLFFLAFSALTVSETQLRESSLEAFHGNVNSIIYKLESDSMISRTWLAQTEAGSRLVLSIQDRGVPLSFPGSWTTLTDRAELIASAQATALEDYGLDLGLPPFSSLETTNVSFTLHGAQKERYLASVSVVPYQGGWYTLTVLKDMRREDRLLLRQRVIFLGLAAVSFLAFLVLNRFFLSRLRAYEQHARKQVEFVAAASHELKSPLAVISASASALRLNTAHPERFTHNIERECGRMAQLVDDLLILAGADAQTWSVRFSPVDWDTLLIECYESYEPLARAKSQRLSLALPDSPFPPYRGDAQRIRQVIAILLDNAVHYTGEGGGIILRADVSAHSLTVQVEDHGPGIPPENRERIFERFYRADQSRSDRDHFGLGLSIARELAALHGGKLFCRDTPGGGSTFVLELPLPRHF